MKVIYFISMYYCLLGVSYTAFGMDSECTTSSGIRIATSDPIDSPDSTPSIDPEEIVDRVLRLCEGLHAYRQDIVSKLQEDLVITQQLSLAGKRRSGLTSIERELRRYLTANYEEIDLSKIKFTIAENMELNGPEAILFWKTYLEKMKFFLGRSSRSPQLKIVPIFKYLLFKRISYQIFVSRIRDHKKETGVGIPSTLPEDYHRLNRREKYSSQVAIDYLYFVDHQLLLLYRLLPLDTRTELHTYLNLPSLKQLIQNLEVENEVKSLTPDEANRMDKDVLKEISLNELNELGQEYANLDLEAAVLDSETSVPGQITLKKKRKKKKNTGSATELKEKEEKGEQDDLDPSLVPGVATLDDDEGKEGGEVLKEEDEAPQAPQQNRVCSKYSDPSSGNTRRGRIQQIIHCNQASSSKASLQNEVFSPLKQFVLAKADAIAYEALFSLKPSRPLEWKSFDKLFTSLGGVILTHKSNGSSRTLIFQVKRNNGSVLFSQRFIHEPHPIYGSTFGYESLYLLRNHFHSWGLGPEQGNVK